MSEETSLNGIDSGRKPDYNLLHGKWLASPDAGDEIVISGMAGCFPESANIEEFKNNLMNNVDMVTPNRHWGNVHSELPKRTGTLPEIDKFDAGFFGFHGRQLQDVLIQLCVERSVEAVLDAGLNPSDLENSRTGVYVGACFSESQEHVMMNTTLTQAYGFYGGARSMLPHRISHHFKLKGPSFATDTACSSSLYALEQAFRAMRLGEIDQAIVGGANLCLHPFVSMQFSRLGVLCNDGVSKVFDDAADGYVRSEAVAILILQKAKHAKRNYAELLYAKSNCDGYKEHGITFPSSSTQTKLLEEFYNESGIDRFSLSFLEAHGTGTPVGDPQEAAAIDKVLAKGKKKRLLVGSVKSNIGHTEAASGICSVIKSIIGLETGVIPPNQNFNTPSKSIKGILEGRLKVVSEPMPFDDDNGLIAKFWSESPINEQGMKLAYNCLKFWSESPINEQGMKLAYNCLNLAYNCLNFIPCSLIGDSLQNFAEIYKHSFGFGGANCHVLLRKNRIEKIESGIPTDNIPRIICLSGRTEDSVTALLDDLQNNVLDVEHIRLLHNAYRLPIFNHLYRGFTIISKSGEMCRFVDTFNGKCRPLYFAFGELNEWFHIGKHLMALPTFSYTIQRIQKAVSSYGVNISNTFSEDSSARVTYHILGSVAVQLGLIDLFKLLNVTPKYFFGYSFGDLISAYASGFMSLEDSVNCALIINESINKTEDLYENASRKYQVNHKNHNVECPLDKLKEYFQAEKSLTARTKVLQNLTNFIKSNEISSKLTKTTLAFAESFVESISNNTPQNFQQIQENSILLTVGTFPIDNNSEDVEVIPVFHRDEESHLVGFLKVLGSLYVNGHNPQLALLYPNVKFPVSRGTRMISPYIKWKHESRLWFCPMYEKLAENAPQRGAKTFKIQLSDQDWSYVDGHVIDGRNLFPATGYLHLAWKTLTSHNDRAGMVVFENCKFMRATTIPTKAQLLLKICLNKSSGNFEIMEGDSTVMSGRIYIVNNESDQHTHKTNIPSSSSSSLKMKTRDIYKELSLRGYNYKKSFRKIIECDVNGTEGRIQWEDNWVTFLDNMLQMKILGIDSRLLYVPTFIEYIQIAPNDHEKWVREEFTDKGREPFLPIYNDASCGEIRCKNTLIRGLIASSIPRRKDLGIPVLEKYTFVPNVTSLELTDSVRVNMQILLENSLVFKVKVIEVIDDFTKEEVLPLAPLVVRVFEDQPLIQCSPKILCQCSLDMPFPVENIKLSEEKDISLLIVSGFFARPELSQDAFSSLKDNGFILTRESLDFRIASAENFDVTICTVHKLQSETHVLLKKNRNPRSPVTLRINSSNDFSWIEKTQKLIQNKSSESLILYSDNRDKSGVLGLVNCLRREPESTFIKGLLVMDDVQEINIDDTIYRKQLQKNMAQNVLKDGEWGTYRHLLANNLNRVENEHCFAYPSIRGDLSSLQWFEGHIRHDMIPPPEKKIVYNRDTCLFPIHARGQYLKLVFMKIYPNIKPKVAVRACIARYLENSPRFHLFSYNQAGECLELNPTVLQVYYSALNFRDIMTASGKLNADIVSGDRTEQECIQGIEFAGVDCDGNRVTGMVSHQALSTMVLADNYCTFTIPDDLSLEEAATIPVVYGTVLNGLIMRAGMKRGESILIHSGTGGVGQAAIRTALHYGCEVFTTVGTREKREFLIQTFPQLKISHIGNSRDTSFEKMVKKRTKGRGVDLVLNSLAEEKLIASIRCLAKRGRFVEIGKFDMSKNSTCNLLLLEKQCSFHGVMVDQLMTSTPAAKSELNNLIKDGIEAGFVKPLNRSIFKFDQLEKAFRFMASGKHMGKVLIQIREPEKHHKVVPPVSMFPCTARYSCNDKDSYIICGGLGGFGLEFADWLVLRGAKKLLLTSRKGVSTGYQEFRIKIWRSYGVNVQISKSDITKKEGCRTLLEEAQKLGDVGGIFNLAVVLADAIFENQNQKSFSTSFAPKPIATKYLDELSRELCPKLRDFVVFSSVTCGRGNAGQTNYGMANSIMERICEERKKDGFPALAIQWGAIGQVGLVAEMQELDCELEIGGTLQQKISNCLNVLDGFLKQRDHTIVSSMVVAEKRGGAENANNIIEAVTNILGLHDTKNVSHHVTLTELGMDSMTAVEIKQILETDFEVSLSVKDMRTLTLAKLKNIHDGRINVTQDNGKITNNNFALDVVFQTYGDESKIALPYIQFESKKKIKTTSEVIFLPGIDGFSSVFETVASNLESQSIAVQYVYSEKPESIQDMTRLLIPTLEKHFTPDKPFTIVAYSFGSVIALEAVSILESKNYHGTVVLIDGSPEVSKQLMKEYRNQPEEALETNLLSHMLSYFISPADVAEIQENLAKCPSWEARVEMTTAFTGNLKSYGTASLKLIINGIYDRMKALQTYTPSYNKLKSKIKLFKSMDPSMREFVEDYGLSQISEQQVDVETLEGSHITVLDNCNLADAVNLIIDSSA